MRRAIGRRALLARAGGLAAAALLATSGLPGDAAAEGLQFGPPDDFDFERLRQRAKAMAGKPYAPPVIRFGDVLDRIDYDAYQQIKFLPGNALWAAGDGPFPVQFFHLARFYKAPVSINLVKDGKAREILYSPSLFTLGTAASFAAALPSDLGFAGFRVMAPDQKTDWLAFLGAAYFRSAGELDQYGLSARGIAIDTALPTPEEFPRFTSFWLEAAPDPATIVIYALMDGPSITGAFRMAATKHGGVVMTIDAALFARAAIERMGVAPLTSMFWYDETNRYQAADWRPEIHDSDGLALWTGAGERIWRPLNNPPRVQTSVFVDRNPKGFGLLQRDRNFDHYQDDGVFYERRPSVWVEPIGDWGGGAVQLVEIPTDDEIHDNIVAYWVPKAPVDAGSEWAFKYRLHWLADEPYPPPLGRVVSTRLGRGGIPGQPRPKDKKKIVIDFAGGPLDELEKGDPVQLIVHAGRGGIDNDYVLQVVGTKRWRAFFDFALDGTDPTDIRAFLRLKDRTLTETWLFQFFPFEF